MMFPPPRRHSIADMIPRPPVKYYARHAPGTLGAGGSGGAHCPGSAGGPKGSDGDDEGMSRAGGPKGLDGGDEGISNRVAARAAAAAAAAGVLVVVIFIFDVTVVVVVLVFVLATPCHSIFPIAPALPYRT